jgi:integrase
MDFPGFVRRPTGIPTPDWDSNRSSSLTLRIEALGDLYGDQGLVFTSEAGTPINPSNLRQRSLAPLLKKAGLPHIRFHDLRHTCATLLLGKGVHPKFVQELLGHATIAITLDTYSHVMPGMGDQTAMAMEDVLR